MSVAERQILRDAVRIGRVNDHSTAETAAALGILGLGQVAFAGVAAQNFDDHAAVEFLVMRGIDQAQAALAQLAFDTEARQSRKLLLRFGRRTAVLVAQLAHAQPGLDALAGFGHDLLGAAIERLPLGGVGAVEDELRQIVGDVLEHRIDAADARRVLAEMKAKGEKPIPLAKLKKQLGL